MSSVLVLNGPNRNLLGTRKRVLGSTVASSGLYELSQQRS
jgi:hypothetical protein